MRADVWAAAFVAAASGLILVLMPRTPTVGMLATTPAILSLQRRLPVPVGLGLIGGAVVAGVAVAGVGGIVASAGATTGILIGLRFVRARRQRRLRRQRQAAVIALCDALAAELHAGLPTSEALARSCSLWPEWQSIAAGARLGLDVSAALQRSAAQPGAEGLRALAAGWRVASEVGAGLTAVVDGIGRGLRQDEDARAEVIAALGPPRATARMMAALPVFGLGLGEAMGAAPLHFLATTLAGRISLVCGVLLALAGVTWVDRLADAVEWS